MITTNIKLSPGTEKNGMAHMKHLATASFALILIAGCGREWADMMEDCPYMMRNEDLFDYKGDPKTDAIRKTLEVFGIKTASYSCSGGADGRTCWTRKFASCVATAKDEPGLGTCGVLYRGHSGRDDGRTGIKGSRTTDCPLARDR